MTLSGLATIAGLTAAGGAGTAGAAEGSCPWNHWPPSGMVCVDHDRHELGVLTGVLDVNTYWYTEVRTGDRAVALNGVIRVDPIGSYTAVAQFRDAEGQVLFVRSFSFSRLHPERQFVWWQPITMSATVDDRVVSVRYTLQDTFYGNVSAAKVSRPTD